MLSAAGMGVAFNAKPALRRSPTPPLASLPRCVLFVSRHRAEVEQRTPPTAWKPLRL